MTTTDEFLTRFQPKHKAAATKPTAASEPKQTMTKPRGKNLIDTRMRSKYKKRCLILRNIVDGISAGGKDWHEFDIRRGICSTPPDRLRKKSQASYQTFRRGIRLLKDDGLIAVFPGASSLGHDQYTVDLTSLEDLPVKIYKSDQSRKAYHRRYYLKRKAKAAADAAVSTTVSTRVQQ
jgi:hypothetical protein